MKKYLLKKINNWILNYLVKYTGVRLDPDPGIWGFVDKDQEQEVLARIYEDELFIMLLKKYAEQANKVTLASLHQTELGKFLAFNGVILKAKRAFKNKNRNDTRKNNIKI